ncbi:inositol 2-dehydrogenase [Alkalibacterium sp. m-11]
MSKNIKFALIGTGRAGLIHGRNFANKVNNAELIALCDPVVESLENAQKELNCKYTYTDYKELMKNPEIDAVIIATPTFYHKEIAVEAANEKKHILCEKPLAMDEQECIDIINATEKNNVKLQVGFMRRFDPSFIEARKAIEDGIIGEVTLVKSLTHGPSSPKEWMFDISQSNGPIGEVNSHDLDTLRWLTGSEISSIYSIGGNFRSPEVKEKYPDFYDTVAMNIEFEDGKLGIIDGAQYVQYGYDARAEILGTKGSILIGSQSKHEIKIATADGKVSQPTMHSWTYLFRDAYQAEAQSFVDSIINNTEPLATGHDGLMSVRLVNAGLKSLLENKVIKVDE